MTHNIIFSDEMFVIGRKQKFPDHIKALALSSSSIGNDESRISSFSPQGMFLHPSVCFLQTNTKRITIIDDDDNDGKKEEIIGEEKENGKKENEDKFIQCSNAYRNPIDYQYNLNIILTEGIGRQYIQNIWEIPISEWNQIPFLLDYWLCRKPYYELENPHLISITHYRRYGEFRLYQFCCIFSSIPLSSSSSHSSSSHSLSSHSLSSSSQSSSSSYNPTSSSSSSSSIRYSQPIWIHYGSLKNSSIYHEQILCGKKYQWNWRIMQNIDDQDYPNYKPKSITEIFDDMEDSSKMVSSFYQEHRMDEAITVMKLYSSYEEKR